jgi:carbamate kinase
MVALDQDEDRLLRGVDAVVDKDATAALMAEALSASTLVILMEADRVYLDWGTPRQRPLDHVTAEEAARLLDAGAFEPGSMAPKLEAAVGFVRATGRDAVICSADAAAAALRGEAGTRVAAS